MNLLILDNTDSFTWNLYHYFEQIDGVQVRIIPEQTGHLADFERADAIVLSPGPGLPQEHALMLAVLNRYAQSKPILGVCLGLQALVEFCGGSLRNLGDVRHGVAQTTFLEQGEELFAGLGERIITGHYHSWVADDEVPDCLKVIAHGPQNLVMAVRHSVLPLYGVQFHPESILTPKGIEILRNFIHLCERWKAIR